MDTTELNATGATNRRWFQPTPGRLLVVLLAVEAILLLSERFQWFAFNEKKGWTVLIAIAAVALTIVLMFLWFAAALVFRWRFQFSIRWLMLLTIAAALPFSWLAVEMKLAKKQKEAVGSLLKLGGIVIYDDQYDYQDNVHRPSIHPAFAWLNNMLGDDYFRNVTLISLKANNEATNADLEYIKVQSRLRMLHLETPQVTDAGLEHLKGLKELHRLEIVRAKITDAGLEHLERAFQLKTLFFYDTQITDAGLKHFKWLGRLERLNLEKSQVTDAGVAELQKALPNCRIER